jgi:hypothetical protein
LGGPDEDQTLDAGCTLEKWGRTHTRASITTLLDAEDTRYVALDVTEMELVILDVVAPRVPTGDPINVTFAQITDMCSHMIVDERSDVGYGIILRQEILVIGVVDVGGYVEPINR